MAKVAMYSGSLERYLLGKVMTSNSRYMFESVRIRLLHPARSTEAPNWEVLSVLPEMSKTDMSNFIDGIVRPLQDDIEARD